MKRPRNSLGQGMTEYIIIVAIIAIAAIAAFKMFGSKIRKSIGSAGMALEKKVDDGVTETDDGLGK